MGCKSVSPKCDTPPPIAMRCGCNRVSTLPSPIAKVRATRSISARANASPASAASPSCRHGFSLGSVFSGNKGDNRLGNAFLDILSRCFFLAAADFPNHHNSFRVGVRFKVRQNIQKGRAGDHIPAYPNGCGNPNAHFRQAIRGFVSVSRASRHQANAALCENPVRHKPSFAFTR